MWNMPTWWCKQIYEGNNVIHPREGMSVAHAPKSGDVTSTSTSPRPPTNGCTAYPYQSLRAQAHGNQLVLFRVNVVCILCSSLYVVRLCDVIIIYFFLARAATWRRSGAWRTEYVVQRKRTSSTHACVSARACNPPPRRSRSQRLP